MEMPKLSPRINSVLDFLKIAQKFEHETINLILIKNIREYIEKHPKIHSLNQAKDEYGSLHGLVSLNSPVTYKHLVEMANLWGDPNTGELYENDVEEEITILPFLKDMATMIDNDIVCYNDMLFECDWWTNESIEATIIGIDFTKSRQIKDIDILTLENHVKEYYPFRYSIYRKGVSISFNVLKRAKKDNYVILKHRNKSLYKKIQRICSNTCFPHLKDVKEACKLLDINYKQVYFGLCYSNNQIICIEDYDKFEESQHKKYKQIEEEGVY